MSTALNGAERLPLVSFFCVKNIKEIKDFKVHFDSPPPTSFELNVVLISFGLNHLPLQNDGLRGPLLLLCCAFSLLTPTTKDCLLQAVQTQLTVTAFQNLITESR